MRVLPGKTRAAVLIACVLALANRPDCDRREPTLTCTEMHVTLAAGGCVDITNPCDPSGDFTRVDGLRLCDAPDGIFVRTNRSRTGTTRQICAASNVAFLDNVEAAYIYAAPGDFGKGAIFITTTVAFSVTASADKTTVDPGETVNLSAVVIGGRSPYSYVWSSNPIGQIAPADITAQNPIVNPTINVTYDLVVTDADGNLAGDGVSILVNFSATIPTVVDTINAGESVQLFCVATGGSGSYVYSWSPATGLDDANIANPTAMPTVTTTYTCTVDDGLGQAQASVEVPVRGTAPALAACFTTSPPNPVPLFDVITFDAGCSAGSIVEYRWWFYADPNTGPPDVTTNPVFMNATPDIPGTYPVTLEVVEQGTGATDRVTHDVVIQ